MIRVIYPLLHFTSFIIFWYLFNHDMGPLPFSELQLHVLNGQSFTFYINLHSYFIWDCSSRPGKAIWKESQTKSNSLDGVIHIWGRMSLKQKNNSTISKLPFLLSFSNKKHFDQKKLSDDKIQYSCFVSGAWYPQVHQYNDKELEIIICSWWSVNCYQSLISSCRNWHVEEFKQEPPPLSFFRLTAKLMKAMMLVIRTAM